MASSSATTLPYLENNPVTLRRYLLLALVPKSQ